VVLLGIEPPGSFLASVYTNCETASVTIAMLVVQAKWFSAVSTSANIQSRENRFGW
jgi:hypothetical protein